MILTILSQDYGRKHSSWVDPIEFIKGSYPWTTSKDYCDILQGVHATELNFDSYRMGPLVGGASVLSQDQIVSCLDIEVLSLQSDHVCDCVCDCVCDPLLHSPSSQITDILRLVTQTQSQVLTDIPDFPSYTDLTNSSVSPPPLPDRLPVLSLDSDSSDKNFQVDNRQPTI